LLTAPIRTPGWRLTAPPPQLVPGEKYDVIHYLCENFLAKISPSRFVPFTAYRRRPAAPPVSGRGRAVRRLPACP
jgi:hypothetical protein